MSIISVDTKEFKTKYKNKYFHEEEIEEGNTIDLLSLVVPCFTDKRFFFGPYVLNIVILTKPYIDADGGSDIQIETTAKVLKEVFPKFLLYESHYWIDDQADGIVDAEPIYVAQTQNQLLILIDNTIGCNVFYHGKLGGEELKASITEVIDAFNLKTQSSPGL